MTIGKTTDDSAYVISGTSPWRFGQFGTFRPRDYTYRRKTRRGANAMAARLAAKGYTGIAISIVPESNKED